MGTERRGSGRAPAGSRVELTRGPRGGGGAINDPLPGLDRTPIPGITGPTPGGGIIPDTLGTNRARAGRQGQNALPELSDILGDRFDNRPTPGPNSGLGLGSGPFADFLAQLQNRNGFGNFGGGGIQK